jgi:signal transduction histidine kinase
VETSEQINLFSLLLPILAVIFIIAVSVIVLNSHFQKNLFKQKLVQEELLIKHQQDLLKSSIEVQEEERKRMAADLHDEMGATLSLIRMRISSLEKNNLQDSDLQNQFLDLKSLTDNAMSAMRRISHDLMPPTLLYFGLISSLNQIAETVRQSNAIDVKVSYPDTPLQLDWSVNLGLYRISMELINNTIKHAKANTIHINLRIENQTLYFRYEDNGIGISDIANGKGLGQKSIEARTVAMNGLIKMGNKEPNGFYVGIEIPKLV